MASVPGSSDASLSWRLHMKGRIMHMTIAHDRTSMDKERRDGNFTPDSATSWDLPFFDLVFWFVKLEVVIVPQSV